MKRKGKKEENEEGEREREIVLVWAMVNVSPRGETRLKGLSWPSVAGNRRIKGSGSGRLVARALVAYATSFNEKRIKRKLTDL